MTLPRQILPGATYLVTRACTQREFLLQPSALTTALFKFTLAVAAKRTGIVLHAACVMSNHYHLVLTDPRAQLPRFAQLLHSMLARALNASYGRWESFWGPSTYSAVRLVSPKDATRKIVYTLANPVFAGLVAHGREWPGLWSAPDRIGAGGEIVQRPDLFFSKSGTTPEREALTFTVPPGFASPEAFRAEVQALLSAVEQRKAERLRKQGARVAGVRRVMRQKHTDRASSRARRRGLKPRIAARDKWKRVEALGRLRDFVRAYREALEKLRNGVRDVVLPPGTYLLRVHLRVACQAA